MQFLLLSLLLYTCSGATYQLEESEYAGFPPLFFLYDYNFCIQANGQYCLIPATLRPDNTSIYKIIQEHSQHTSKNYNRTYLRYGLCLSKKPHHGEELKKKDLNDALEKHLNNHVKSRIQADIIFSDVTCAGDDEKMNFDVTDTFVAIVFVSLFLINAAGSLCDYFIKKSNIKTDRNVLICFSIQRNWQSLIKLRNVSSSSAISLHGIDGMRTINSIILIGLHCLFPFIVYIENPRFFEKASDIVILKMLLTLCANAVQTFFIMSGFFLAFNFKERNVTLKILLKKILNRWLRLTPAYAFVLAANLSWLKFYGSGPLWQSVALSEVGDCRKNFWLHLLYVNNYIDNSRCMLHSWSLATDLQLHIVGLLVCFLSEKGRRQGLILLITIGLIVPAVQTFLQDLDGILIMSPENSLKILFKSEKTFNLVYRRGHTNLACFFIGMSLGFFTAKQRTALEYQKITKQRFVYYLTLPAILVWMYLGNVFYTDALRPSVFIHVLFAALYKPVFGAIVGTIMMGAVLKYEGIFRGILEWNVFAIPAKLSYCAYLIQFVLIKMAIGSSKTLVRASLFELVKFFVTITIVSFLLALPLWLLVENPMQKLINLWKTKEPKLKQLND